MNDLVRVVDGLGWPKPWIAGQSWGGRLAMHFAVAHPERTGALVVIDSWARWGTAEPRSLART